MTDQPTRPSPGAPSPDFGPGGFLPERAAKRARKIVLREQMSAGWPLASLAAGLVLFVAAAVFLLTRTGAPGPPFLPVAELDALAPASVERADLDAGEILLVHTGGAVRVFAAPTEAVTYCRATGNLEGADGSVWRVSGQRIAGTGLSLGSFPVTLHRGTVYVDPTAPRPPPPPAGGQAGQACP